MGRRRACCFGINTVCDDPEINVPKRDPEKVRRIEHSHHDVCTRKENDQVLRKDEIRSRIREKIIICRVYGQYHPRTQKSFSSTEPNGDTLRVSS